MLVPQVRRQRGRCRRAYCNGAVGVGKLAVPAGCAAGPLQKHKQEKDQTKTPNLSPPRASNDSWEATSGGLEQTAILSQYSYPFAWRVKASPSLLPAIPFFWSSNQPPSLPIYAVHHGHHQPRSIRGTTFNTTRMVATRSNIHTCLHTCHPHSPRVLAIPPFSPSQHGCAIRCSLPKLWAPRDLRDPTHLVW